MSSKLLLGLIGTGCAAMAFGSSDPVVLAKAEALLKSSDAKLASARTLRATYTEEDEHPGEYQDLRQTGTLNLERPDRYRLEIVRARRVKASDPWKDSGNTTLSVSDGQQISSAFFHSHSTQVRNGEAKAAPKLDEVPILAGFFAGNRSPATVLTAADQAGEVADVSVAGSRVEFKVGDIKRTVEVGEDGLIHRLVVQNTTSHVTKTWTLNSIAFDRDLSASTFQYASPKDAIPYPAAEKSGGFAVGESVPDFEVSSVDNKPLHLSDFKGKVVVLEFWATWCWPCNQSIPETHRLVSTYRQKGVEGFLVSIKDNRKGFDAWVKKHPQFRDLKFAFDDPVNGQAYEAFLHPTNPTLYVIGRDGKVLLKTQGYTGPNPEVEKAIQTAL